MIAVARDTLIQISEIYPPYSQDAITFGDTDHDGRNEVILLIGQSGVLGYRILEEQGANVYSDEYSGADLIPYATGDLDGDGKAEIIGQLSYWIQVYESLDATSYPTQLVWTSPALSNIFGQTVVGDTDRDGRMEIIHSVNSFGGSSQLVIFENTADNTFTQVFSAPMVGSGGATGEKVIADFDGDGLMEIATSSVNGRIFVFESPADNTWVQTWTDKPLVFFNAYGVEGGRDTDGDGRPELFVMGESASGATTYVYEATADNQFARVAELSVSGGGFLNALGQVDGVGADEYVLTDGGDRLYIYHAVAPGEWIQVCRYDGPDVQHLFIHCFDANRNGRDEIFWDGQGPLEGNLLTLVLEHPAVPPSAADNFVTHGRRGLSIFPFPCSNQAVLHFSGSVYEYDAARINVFDAAGRLVERRIPLVRSGTLLWNVHDLSSGVYHLRIEDRSGAPLATGRAVVVH